MMRVLYFHQHFSTPQGATGIRSYQMARRLIDRGHAVTMVCGSYAAGRSGLSGPFDKGIRRGRVDGIDVIECDLPYSNSDGFVRRAMVFLTFMWRTIGIALREPCDVVFATTTPLTVGVPGIVARWLRRKPFVFEVRDLWPEIPKTMGVIRNPVVLAALGVLEWASYRSAHRLVGLSPGIVDGIARLGVARDRIAMIPNGCDLAIFDSATIARRPHGVADTDLMAIFAGTHGMANGLDAVIDAAAEIDRRGRDDIRIVLIGNGMLKPALQERAAQLRLRSLIFLDPVPKADLAALLAGADLGMQTLANIPAFYYGTSPNKFFDYIAAGMPVLNNYPGWLAEMIVADACGFAVPPDDPTAFADALERAADDRPALQAAGSNAAALAKRDFSRAMLADRWVDWIEQAARVNPARHTKS